MPLNDWLDPASETDGDGDGVWEVGWVDLPNDGRLVVLEEDCCQDCCD